MKLATLPLFALPLLLVGCADDRDDSGLTTAGTSVSVGDVGDDGVDDGDGDGGDGADDGADDDGADDGGPGDGGDGADDGPGDGGDGADDGGTSGGDTAGDDGGTDTGAGDDGGGDDGEVSPTRPDCDSLWTYYGGGQYINDLIASTREEMFCHVIGQRISYSFHGRNDGCGWNGMTGNDQTSWPYEMDYDVGLMGKAQDEADRIGNGGSPNGSYQTDGSSSGIYLDGCGGSRYVVTSEDTIMEWLQDETPGLSSSNGTARMSVFYYDPGPSAPTLTKLGVGLHQSGDDRTWVLMFE